MASRLLGSRTLIAGSKPARAWPFYLCFSVGVGILHLALAGLGAWLLWIGGDVARGPEVLLLGGSLVVSSGLLGIAYGYAPFAPRRPWAWRYHLVLLVLGLPMCLPLAAPLLFLWFRADTKRMFAAT